jgi:MoaA/NifB/PqqE/SkfB family radical SAM enzyme
MYNIAVQTTPSEFKYGLRPGAEEFPLQIIIATIYPCNLGCPLCPYTDGNSEIRKFYHEHDGDLFPPELFKKIAHEAAPYKAFLRLTGGGEPTLHPQMFDLIEYAKSIGARVWLNTNGTLLGPHTPRTKKNLERLIECGVDLIEFSVDAGDPETYNVVRPPRRGKGTSERWHRLVAAIRYTLEYRKKLKAQTRVVCSIIMDDIIKGKIDQALSFWLEDVGVDEVIKRKYLTWDDNTHLDPTHSADPNLYREHKEDLPPCVYPFERLNVDTLGRIALCGQDIAFRTAGQFPNLWKSSIKEIWQGEAFRKYRDRHLAGQGDSIWPCSNCSAWKAGIRDWNHGWLKVLATAEKHRQQVLSLADVAEVGTQTDIIRKGEKIL